MSDRIIAEAQRLLAETLFDERQPYRRIVLQDAVTSLAAVLECDGLVSPQQDTNPMNDKKTLNWEDVEKEWVGRKFTGGFRTWEVVDVTFGGNLVIWGKFRSAQVVDVETFREFAKSGREVETP